MLSAASREALENTHARYFHTVPELLARMIAEIRQTVP